MTRLYTLCLFMIHVSARVIPWTRRSAGRHIQQQRGVWTTPHSLPRGGASQSDVSTQNTTLTTKPPPPAWKQALPSPLREKGPKTLQKLKLCGVEIYLIGTAHVSNDSSIDVQILLESVRPDAVFVELCESRIPLLEGVPTNTSSEDDDRGFWERLRQVQRDQGGSQLQALTSVMLTSVQEDYAKELEVELGGEFRVAHRYWKQQHVGRKTHLILGDRPLQITLKRAWESLGWFAKIKVIVGLLWSSFQRPKKEELIAWLNEVRREETDVLTESLAELRKHFPTLYTSIIEERDLWLAAKLVQLCRGLQRSGASTVVAIVGAGHCEGIIRHMTNQTMSKSPEDILSELVTTRRSMQDPSMKEAMASWVYDVTELQDMPDASFEWAQPGLQQLTRQPQPPPRSISQVQQEGTALTARETGT